MITQQRNTDYLGDDIMKPATAINTTVISARVHSAYSRFKHPVLEMILGHGAGIRFPRVRNSQTPSGRAAGQKPAARGIASR